MTNRLVYHDDVDGSLRALDPAKATGIAIPAFSIGNALPTAGQTVGEGYLVAPTKTAYLWDGNRWSPITPSPILNYATDAAILADKTQPPGSYAVSNATGNLFTAMTGGTWKQQGVRTYATQAALIADVVQVAGALGFATDTKLHFAWDGARWVPMSVQIFATEALLLAKITGNVNSQIAVAQDTSRLFVWDGAKWDGQPFRNYATETALLAATPVNGTLAVADDTAVPFIRAAGIWKRLAGSNITVGAALPTTGIATGDLFYNITDGNLSIRGSTAWEKVGSKKSDLWAVGSIQQSILTEAQFQAQMGTTDWALVDGRSIAGSKLAQITGKATLDDMRGAFFRAAGQNSNNGASWNGGALNSFHDYTTARPRNTPFTTDNPGNHQHGNGSGAQINSDGGPNWISGHQSDATSPAGAHTHTITGGGDVETAPSHFSLNTFIKIN